MGASPSIVLSSYESSDENSMEECAWLKIGINTDTPDNFHKLDITARSDNSGVSLMDQEKDIILVSGCSWEHRNIPQIEDDESNLAQIYRFAGGMKQDIQEFCNHSGLFTPMEEIHRRPNYIPSDKVYINAVFYAKDNTGAIVRSVLAGCMLKNQMQLMSDNDTEQEGLKESRSWQSRLANLLPGQQFSESRRHIMEWWGNIMRVSDMDVLQSYINEHKLKFMVYSKRLSDAYLNAVVKGSRSAKGLKSLDDCQRWKQAMRETAAEMSKELLSTVFDAGINLFESSSTLSEKTYRDFHKKVAETKHNLVIVFENGIDDLISYIETHEQEAWKDFTMKINDMKSHMPNSMSLPPDFESPISSPKISPREKGGDSPPASSGKKHTRRYSISPLAMSSMGDKPLLRPRSSASIMASSLSTTRARLSRRLDLLKQQKIYQENFQFLASVVYHFRFLMFESKVHEQMVSYLDRENEALRKSLQEMRSTHLDKLIHKHSKEKAKAIADGLFDQDEQQITSKQEAQLKKLEMKINERVRHRERRFEDSRFRTMEKLESRMKHFREEISGSLLSPKALATIKNILYVYSMMKRAPGSSERS